MIDFNNIKLIIWDLDECFWKGTLSEDGVHPIEDNIKLVKDLADKGIVNSICSKNDFYPTIQKLKEFKIHDYFVFPSIDWTPKGQRIAKLIKDMGLRPVNCLFIDDNVLNLNEAKFYATELMVAEPTIISELRIWTESLPITDSQHKRLKNYQVLERKQDAKAHASDNLAFLYSTHTQVRISHDCNNYIDRIFELVSRTNQLNYTKVRSTKEELISLLNDDNVDAGYVTVKDDFGDYGIVGFYAVKNHRCIHFLFSCRTIGQGVEQFVYAAIGYPQLDVVGEVVTSVTTDEKPGWINQDVSTAVKKSEKTHSKVVFKGGCDLKNMAVYLQVDNVIEEFTYIGEHRKNNIEHHNHSTNYLAFNRLSDAGKQELLQDCIFNDEDMFNTSMYDEDVSIIFLGTMIEPNLGIYQNKDTGYRIAFGEYKYPLTDQSFWEGYVRGDYYTADNHFTREWLQEFSNKYEFVGCLTPDEILDHMNDLLSKISPKAKLCLLLGSETPFEKNEQNNYENRHLVYKQINDRLRNLSRDNEKVLLIDFNNYIRGQEDFTNNINHFERRVYYEAALKANEYIAAITGNKLKQKSWFYMWIKMQIDHLGKTGFFQSRFYKIASIPYYYIREKLRSR